MYADIAIIGGGASGLAAAISAKMTAPEAEVVIAERLDRVGKKILSTGNGRCNLSNRDITPEHYHGSVKNVMKMIAGEMSAEELFMSMGVLCISDDQGRIYPRSESAATVLNALRIRTEELGITEKCSFELTAINNKKNGYELVSSLGETLFCKGIVIASGGYAAPKMGTDGTVMRILRDRGYKTAKLCPSLAPLKAAPERLKGLKGVRVKGCVSAIGSGKLLRTEYGEIQFTENAVSGICVFNLSRFFGKYEGELKLRLDLAPDMELDELEAYIKAVMNQRRNKMAEGLLTGMFSRPLAVYLVKNTLDVTMNTVISSLDENVPKRLAAAVKSLEFEVTGCSSWANAQVTAGGIHGSCVDEKLGSVIDSGVYLCGEILDVDGDCGGYNLQWAWSSGMIAGRSCAVYIKEGAGK